MQMADMIALKYIHAAGTGMRENKEGRYNSTCDNYYPLAYYANMIMYYYV